MAKKSKKARVDDDFEDQTETEVEETEVEETETEESDEEETVDEAEQDEGTFKISKRKFNKPEMMITAISLTKKQTNHLTSVAKEQGTTRAEFCRQAVAFCLEQLGAPMPKG